MPAVEEAAVAVAADGVAVDSAAAYDEVVAAVAPSEIEADSIRSAEDNEMSMASLPAPSEAGPSSSYLVLSSWCEE